MNIANDGNLDESSDKKNARFRFQKKDQMNDDHKRYGMYLFQKKDQDDEEKRNAAYRFQL